MKKLYRPIFDQCTIKGFKPFMVGLLIILCLLSSCSVRKGIQSFASGEGFEYFDLGKIAKAFVSKSTSVDYPSSSCKVLTQGLDEIQSSSKQESSKIAMIPLLFFLLPGFLISSLVTTKEHAVLPVPYSWLRWLCLTLFLQNRLLLL